MIRSEKLGGKIRNILDQAVRTRQNQVQDITLKMGWKIDNLYEIVVENKVTESIRLRGLTTKGRPTDVGKVEVPNKDKTRVRRNSLEIPKDLGKTILRETRGKIDNTDQKWRDQANLNRNNLKLRG